MKYTAIHEVGHSYDEYAGNISSSEEFQKIFKEEQKESGLIEQMRKDSREYFAEAFAYYFMEQKRLKELAPLTYQFMNSFIATIDSV